MSSSSAIQEHVRLHDRAGTAAVEAALAELRAQGERITAPRRAVLTLLGSRHDHLTADQVAEMLAPEGVHRATVYRTLELLAETGILLYRREPGGATSYHLATAAAGHEHLHGRCRSCGAVVPLPATVLDAAIEAISASGFRLEPQHSTLAGLCAACVERRG